MRVLFGICRADATASPKNSEKVLNISQRNMLIFVDITQSALTKKIIFDWLTAKRKQTTETHLFGGRKQPALQNKERLVFFT